MFIGRDRQLAALDRSLRRVLRAEPANPGRALLVRGRRRVGKSRLVEEYLTRAGVPYVYFTASNRQTRDELRSFAAEVEASNLPDAALFQGLQLDSWESAFRLLASALPESGAVLVIDELPYLTTSDPGFEGTLQKMWDRDLSRRRVLLIGVGSDLAMMEQLNAYGRPFHQRAQEMVVPALSPAEVGEMLQLEAADAFDAYLVTGGLPLICDEWPTGSSMWEYLQSALQEPTTALLVSAERALAAEFPTEALARTVLTAIGSGERTFTNIGRAAGDLQQGSLNRSLKLLISKRVVAVDQPLSTRATKEKRYRVDDPYLRFWLAFLGEHIAEVERGRGDRVLGRIEKSWTSWRGRAIEPVLRESLDRSRLLAQQGEATDRSPVVGAYWTRTNNPEIDIVIADKRPIADNVMGVGSIKWLDKAPFGSHDLNVLVRQRSELPGANGDTPLLAVSRAGCAVEGITAYGPEELLAAWRPSLPLELA